jgi:acyl-CoA reductase-like NAD-dependent aldehyde dehydrogenase
MVSSAESRHDLLAQAHEVVRRARLAQTTWAATPFRRRQQALVALAKAIVRNRSEVLVHLEHETGRSATDSLLSEIVGVVDYAKGATRVVKTALEPEWVRLSPLVYPNKRAVVERLPRGVVGIIAPWNYPLSTFYKAFFPALAAGNAVVFKPSERAPKTGAWLADLAQAFLPKNLVGLLEGGPEAGQALLEAPIDGIVFTGSVSGGRRVGAIAGEKLIPASLELGGNDAAIVLEDCALDRTVIGIAQWAFHNAGQDCAAIERVFVERAIADRFIESLVNVTRRLRVPGESGPWDLGPLLHESERARIEAHIADALAQGAQLLTGGTPTETGRGFRPTILDGCTPNMRVMREESFGPIVAIRRVDSAIEAVKLANDCDFGLNGSVWTKDLARGEAIAKQLEVGVALVNNHALTGIMPGLPWTGTKNTGPGIAGGALGLHVFLRPRTVLVDGHRDPDPWWMPLDNEAERLARRLLDRALGSPLALLELAPLVKRRVQHILRFVRSGGR